MQFYFYFIDHIFVGPPSTKFQAEKNVQSRTMPGLYTTSLMRSMDGNLGWWNFDVKSMVGAFP